MKGYLLLSLLLLAVFISACYYSLSGSLNQNVFSMDFNSRREAMFWKQIGPGSWKIQDGYLLIHNKERHRPVPYKGLPTTFLLMRKAFNSHNISVQVEGEILEVIAPFKEEPGVGILLWSNLVQHIQPHTPPYDSGYSLSFTVKRTYLFGGFKKPIAELEDTTIRGSSPFHLTPYRKFTLEIRQNLNVIQGYLDGELIVDAIDPYYSRRCLSDWIGLAAAGLKVKFDNLRVEWGK